MKRKWQHPSEEEVSRIHWRSLGELEGSPEFKGWLEREFPQGAGELELDDSSRRGFLKLMGASTALAGFGVACSRPLEHLVPYNDHVEWVIPGKALYYSTAKPRLGGLGCDPLVVTTHEGRPTKVDGNRLHPATGGGSTAFTQASILDLYDQDRSRGYRKGGKATVRQDFEEGFLKPFREAKSGAKAGVLLSPSTSPTRKALLADLAKAAPGIRFFSYEALAPAGAMAAAEVLYGAGVLPVVNLSSVDRVLSLDCDFLGNDPVGEDSTAEFSATRHPDREGGMSRLYSIEPSFTVTGGQADHRYRLPASQVLPVAALIAKELGAALGDASLSSMADAVATRLVPAVYNLPWIRECAADLAASKGKAILVAGSRQPVEVHYLVAAANKALGAYGASIALVNHGLPASEGIAALSAALEKGEVETLFVLNEGDVAFDAPANLGLTAKLKALKTLVHVGVRYNETAKLATWHVPGAHYLESWGDHYSLSGVYSVQQPMINPLWGGYSVERFLLSLIQEDDSGKALNERVKAAYAAAGGKDWTLTLRDGFAKEIQLPVGAMTGDPAAQVAALAKASIPDFPHPQGLEVVLAASSATFDGRFVNNGWLQEAPDPITKLTWDNAALISFFTAAELGLEDGDLVELSVGDRKVQAPVLRVPGQADFVVILAVGYYGDLADETVSQGVGFNAYPLMTTVQPYVVPGVVAQSLKRKHALALTAEHYSMEGRAIAREGTVEMLKKDPVFAQYQGMDSHIPENISLYKGVDYMGAEVPEGPIVGILAGHEFRVDPHHQWAMTVDLNTCIGCNACVIACQSENNIPIVGKEQVINGREMHWIRMDRYFTSPKDKETVAELGNVFDYIAGKEKTKIEPGKRPVDDDQIEMIPQPVACQQCESAPCETVCPVNATVHTGDGLNAMTYNRCIGTRYCANNCPYKARRFNYYDYNKRPIEKITVGGVEASGLVFGPLAPVAGNATTTQQLQKNPNVTVRMRGVIEKCTYCVQRINTAKIAAKAAARDSADVQVKANSFTVACQDACSAGAITFGNLKAVGDKIIEAKKNPRNYDLLKYIGTRPRTSYLARIKNPNPKMPGAEYVGTVTSQMH